MKVRGILAATTLVLSGCATAAIGNAVRPAAGIDVHSSAVGATLAAQAEPAPAAPIARPTVPVAPLTPALATSRPVSPSQRTITVSGSTPPSVAASAPANAEPVGQASGQPACPPNPGSGLPCVVR